MAVTNFNQKLNMHEVQTTIVYAQKIVSPVDPDAAQRRSELSAYGNKDDVQNFLTACDDLVKAGSKLEGVEL